jgi:opacity protein-like surface antigen
MNSFKRFAFILVIVLFASTSYAQRSSGWSMVFTWDRFNAGEYPITSVATGQSFQNLESIGGIGLEYKMSYQWALQVGLSFGTQSAESSGEGTSSESSQTQYGIAAGPVFYFRGYDVTGIRPYLGGRLAFGGYSSSSEQSSGTARQTVEFSTSSFGAALFGGADVELLSGLRVGAGYGLSFTSFPESEQETTIASTGSSTTTKVTGPSASEISTFFHMTLKFLF